MTVDYTRRDLLRRGWLDALAQALAEPRSPIRVDAERCFSAMDCPCEVCVERCPFAPAPIRVRLGSPPEIGADCNGCGDCAFYCPAGALASRAAAGP